MENGFKFSASKTVCVHFCQQIHPHPEPQVLLIAHPSKASRKQNFLVSFSYFAFSFKSHQQYLKNLWQKCLDILRVVGHTDWSAGSPSTVQVISSIETGQRMHCLWVNRSTVSQAVTFYTPPGTVHWFRGLPRSSQTLCLFPPFETVWTMFWNWSLTQKILHTPVSLNQKRPTFTKTQFSLWACGMKYATLLIVKIDSCMIHALIHAWFLRVTYSDIGHPCSLSKVTNAH